MKKKLLSFHSECILQRNGITIPFNKSKTKMKAIHLYAYYEKENLSLLQSPSIHICEISSEETILYQFSLLMIKKILRPYIQEGKITIELLDENKNSSHSTRIINASDMSLTNSIKIENSFFCFISNSSKEMLSHFCSLVADVLMKFKALKNENKEKNEIPMNIENSLEEKQKNKMQEEKKLKEPENRRKINRSVLSQNPIIIHNGNNQNISNNNNARTLIKKRNFNVLSIENSQEFVANVGQKMNNSKKSIKIFNFFEKIPDIILEKIIMFIPNSEFKVLKLVSKDFYKNLWRNLRHLNFKGNPAIPPTILRKFFEQTEKVEKISCGQFKHITPTFFYEIFNFQQNNQIKEIDLTKYNKTNDKILIKIFQTCKKLECLKLPYLSNVTKESLLSMSTYLKEIHTLEIKYNGPTEIQTNSNITDTSLANILEKNENLKSFYLAYVSNIFSEAFFKPNIVARIKIIKITNFVFSKLEQMGNLVNLMYFPNLEYLKILHFLLKNQLNLYEPIKLNPNIFENIVKNCKKIQKIKFGEWFDNELLLIMVEHLKEIREFSIKNNQNLDDLSLEIFFQSSLLLEKIDISECSGVNGNCFESLSSPNLSKVVVSLNSYGIKCLEEVFDEKKLKPKLINKIAKKYL